VGDHLQERLDSAFPATTDAQLVRAVHQGVLLADGVIDNEAWLRGPLGRDVRGHLRRAGILSRVHAACVAGDLPFEATLDHMPRGPFHWVEVASGGFTAHICRTDSPSGFPEDTPTRQDERLTNRIDLFENVVPMKQVADSVPELFTWLTFGIGEGSQLGHLCWAMPARDEKSWLAHTNVLYRLAAAQIRVEPEAPPERAKIQFKEQVAEALEAPQKAANEDRVD
jgi:hypothetical protein